MIVRILTFFAFAAYPAFGWEASATGPVCMLSHQTGKGDIKLSFDPRLDKPYSIDLGRLDKPWIAAPIFAMRFDGPGRFTITTDRHRLSEDNQTLTVTDKGFGNVLDGLEYNHVATALLGNQILIISLAGAAPEVAKFKSCVITPTA